MDFMDSWGPRSGALWQPDYTGVVPLLEQIGRAHV